jgi:hypothetical protein
MLLVHDKRRKFYRHLINKQSPHQQMSEPKQFAGLNR